MESIQLFFKPTRTISYSQLNDFYIVKMSSVKDIQKVINFFSFDNNHPLIGYKKEMYNSWIKSLMESSRYKNLNFPPLNPKINSSVNTEAKGDSFNK